jgi:hypothetical protein
VSSASHRRRAALVAFGGLAAFSLAALSCGDLVHAPLDRLSQPTGLALSPRGGWLLVSNGDWGQDRDSSSVVALELTAIEASLANPADAGAKLDTSTPCRRIAGRARIECDPSALIDSANSVRMGRGAGNIASYERAPGQGRALVPTRIDPSLTWLDVDETSTGKLTVRCDQDLDRFCRGAHVREDAGPAPARIEIDEEGFGYAYLPQILQPEGCDDNDDPDCSGMTLIDLQKATGPEVADFDRAFFREDPFFDSGLSGGFSVAQRICDPEAPADLNRDCGRPLLYASQRYWNGVRLFTVAPGTSLLLGNVSVELNGANVEAAHPLPLNGDLAFRDPDHLLMVHTTPPALSLIDTSIDEEGELLNTLQASLPLCANPNLLELWQPSDAADLALVSCYSDRRVSVIDLDTFTVFRTLHLGDGPNEMLIDAERRWLLIANVLDDSISVVSLDATSPDYLLEIATIGLERSREFEA